jgi:hypothetical protein
MADQPKGTFELVDKAVRILEGKDTGQTIDELIASLTAEEKEKLLHGLCAQYRLIYQYFGPGKQADQA